MNDVDVLAHLFGSKVAARLLKFLFRHPQEAFRVGEVARLIGSNYNTTHNYIKEFEIIDLVKLTKPKTKGPADEPIASSGKAKKSADKPDDEAAKLYVLNAQFRLIEQLRDLVAQASPIAETSVVENLQKLGKVRLALFSGIFVSKENIPIDLFVVADDVVEEKFKAFVGELEADVGRALNYTLMDTNEFTYRFNIYDRFVRNIFKYPHKKLVDSLNVSL